MEDMRAIEKDRRPLKIRVETLVRRTIDSWLTRVGVASALLATVLSIWIGVFAEPPHAAIFTWAIGILYATFAVVVFGFLADFFNALVGNPVAHGDEVRLPTASEVREVATAVISLPAALGRLVLWVAAGLFVAGGIVGLLLIGWRAIAG